MSQNETPITVVGNLVDDPILRFTPSGAAVANFRVASTPRKFNSQTNQWEDGEALFLTCNVWRQAAENVAETISKGMRIIVTGRLRQRSFQTKEGENRTVYEIEVDEVGPSLKYASAQVNRDPGKSTGTQDSSAGFGQQPPAAPQGNTWGQPTTTGQADPWNSGPQGGFGGAQDDQAPF